MSTGGYDRGEINVSSGYITTNYDMKSWSGGDGKYDAEGNPQWNAYVMNSVKRVRKENPSGFILDCYLDTPFVFGSDPNLELKALNGLAEQIKGFDFNALVAYGERAQTIKLVVDSVKSLVTCVKHVSRGNVTAALKAVGYSGKVPKRHRFNHEDIASRFLEIQYGWIPLLSDVFGAMTAYHKLTSSARSKIFKASSATNQIVTVPYVKGSSRQVMNERIIFYAKLSESPSIARQLGLLDPVSLAWEKRPFSFVGDWFIPIGTYLATTNFIESLQGSFLKTTVQKGTMIESGQSLWVMDGPSTAQVASMQRELLTSLPVPYPAFKPLDKALSAEHVTNAIALVTSVFGGGSRVR